MKINSSLSNNFKITCFLLIITLILTFGTESISAQEVIYKKDSTKVDVVHLEKNDKIVSFKLEGDPTGVVHYFSINAIDSIRFGDGTIERFQPQVVTKIDDNRPTKLLKNSIGLNIWPLFNSKFNFYYERLFLNNKLGFKNYFLIDAGTYTYTYGSLNQMATFYYSAGLNYYFLQSYFFRAGTGFSVLTGKFGNPYWDYYYGNGEVNKYTNQTGVLLNVSAWYLIHKRVNSSIGIEIPLGFDFPDNTIIFKTEISINF